jgi:hypothetical protein
VRVGGGMVVECDCCWVLRGVDVEGADMVCGWGDVNGGLTRMRIECFGVVCVENKVDMTCGVKRRARSVARKRDEHA